MKLSEVSEKDYDTVFYPGGHGPMWDLPDGQDSIKLLESFVKVASGSTLNARKLMVTVSDMDKSVRMGAQV